MSEQTQFLNSIKPLIPCGLAFSTITVDQTFGEGLLNLTGTKEIKIQVNGPQTELTEADVAGVYPARSSTNSPDDFLPHVALNRRTLPWERNGPSLNTPWLALLLVKDSELKVNSGTKVVPQTLVSDGSWAVTGTVADALARDPLGTAKLQAFIPAPTKFKMLFLKNSIVTAIRPAAEELKFLCNVRRTNRGAGDVDCSIVISNRLPDASGTPELHTAFLVSLEGRTDVYDIARTTFPQKETVFVVLHSWSFTPSRGGDFEEVIRSIQIRPNGGVMRFGNLPQSPLPGKPVPLTAGFDAVLDEHGLFIDPLPHTQEKKLVNFRGPLRPFPPGPRSSGFAVRSAPEEFVDASADTPLDYSHAAAFELGRLLALASQDILEDLREVHRVIKVIDPQVAINKLPIALQKPEWIVDPPWEQQNPGWEQQPWSLPAGNNIAPIIKDGSHFIGAMPGDVSGVSKQLQKIGNDVQTTLGNLQTPGILQVTQIDIATISTLDLDKAFGHLAAKGQV